jgi:hypothetical protein
MPLGATNVVAFPKELCDNIIAISTNAFYSRFPTNIISVVVFAIDETDFANFHFQIPFFS